MSPIPVNFGDPEITMRSGDPVFTMNNPPDGWYMGQQAASGPLYSRYSDGVPANVPGDSLSPAPVSLAGKQILGEMDFSTIPAGENVIRIEFTRPILNEKAQEFLGLKGSSGAGPEVFEAFFEPIASGMFKVFAASTFGAPGGSSTITSVENFGTRRVNVADPSNFAVGQDVMILNPVGGERSVVRIEEITGNELAFESDVLIPVESGATIETVLDQVELSEGPDYIINLTTSEVTLVDNVNTQDKFISIEYTTVNTDYDGADFWIIPGVHPITGNDDFIRPDLIPSFLNAEQVGSSGPADETFEFRKSGNCNGKDYTLYIVAKDDEAIPNPSKARAIPFTFIPSRPVTVTTEVGDGRVTISWNDVTDDGSFTDGYSIVRSNGAVFNPANAQRLNVNFITNTQFTDEAGAVNRVADTVVPPPVNGNTFSYAIESAVNTNLWQVLTRNQRLDQTEVIQAQKSLSDP